ncbi:MAG: arylsulfotransferase family protein [candidate division KSB1 bacterium]|nr:arylsulfotransferase family protein [candidate division KSB1 bacterium]
MANTKQNSGKLSFFFFVVSLMIFAFICGLVFASFEWFPYPYFQKAWYTAKTLWQDSTTIHNLNPARYPEKNGVLVNKQDKVYPGITLISGAWNPDDEEWHYGIRLVDMQGNIVNEWKLDPAKIWPKSPHTDHTAGLHNKKRRTMIHGAHIYPNGDIVFNFEYLTLVRMDWDGNIIWKLPYRTHHSVFEDENKSLWVCGAKWREERVPEYPHLNPNFTEDMIVKVSPDGEIEREISILKALYECNYYGLLFFDWVYNTDDVTHLNNVEVLSSDMAENFELFDTGDILISMRYINSVMVIDGKTEKIKWSFTHPFVAQHDPDFHPDGTITVFNNGLSRKNSESVLGGSEILKIDPVTKSITPIYGHKEDQYFYTNRGGKHQHLPNGNMIITECQAGRVFEVTLAGELVWDWHTSKWNENMVAEIMQGTRLPEGYLTFLNE